MKSEAHSPADEWNVQALLDDETDATALDSTLSTLRATPSLMGALTAAQFVKDALNGNPCPDRHYTLRIMQFIAAAEASRK
jgi:hypothetical protein